MSIVGFSYFVVCQSQYQSHRGHMTHCPEMVCAQIGASYRTEKILSLVSSVHSGDHQGTLSAHKLLCTTVKYHNHYLNTLKLL